MILTGFPIQEVSLDLLLTLDGDVELLYSHSTTTPSLPLPHLHFGPPSSPSGGKCTDSPD